MKLLHHRGEWFLRHKYIVVYKDLLPCQGCSDGAKLQKTSGLNKYKEVDFGLSSIPFELAAECGEKESGVVPVFSGATPLEVVTFAISSACLLGEVHRGETQTERLWGLGYPERLDGVYTTAGGIAHTAISSIHLQHKIGTFLQFPSVFGLC